MVSAERDWQLEVQSNQNTIALKDIGPKSILQHLRNGDQCILLIDFDAAPSVPRISHKGTFPLIWTIEVRRSTQCSIKTKRKISTKTGR